MYGLTDCKTRAEPDIRRDGRTLGFLLPIGYRRCQPSSSHGERAMIFTLPGDAEPTAPLYVDDHLTAWAGGDPLRRATASVAIAIMRAAEPLFSRLSRGEIPGDPTRIIGSNAGGDKQKALDVATHDFFVELLTEAGAAFIGSEEAEEPVPGAAGGLVAVAVDPVDGSGNIGIGAPLGTFFSVVPAEGANPFLKTGRAQLAAGYISYGHTIDMGLTVGDGTLIATRDPSNGRFQIVVERLTIPAATADLAYNASNQRNWAPGVQAYVADCLAGKDGPRGKNFNQRWFGAAVGDLHRIMRRGGLFFYVGDKRPGYEKGRLRLVYEANPIAMLCEQAGGAATDGLGPILDILPREIHEHTPLVFGSREEVAAFADYSRR